MKQLCGAKARSNGHQPCKRPAMANGRCRLHGGLSTGPKTVEGKMRIGLAHTTTGLRTNFAIEAKRRCRRLVMEIQEFMNRVKDSL